MQLTQMEALQLSDRINSELMLIEKFASAASICQDAELKRCFQEIQQSHQRHYNHLLNQVGASSQFQQAQPQAGQWGQQQQQWGQQSQYGQQQFGNFGQFTDPNQFGGGQWGTTGQIKDPGRY